MTRKPYRPGWSDRLLLIMIDALLIGTGAQMGPLASTLYPPPASHKEQQIMWALLSIFVASVFALRGWVAKHYERPSEDDEILRQLAELRAEIVVLRQEQRRPRRWWQR